MAAAADVPSPPRWLGTLVVIPLFGLIATALIALRIMERGEIWLDRTYWLVSHAALGGLAGAALVKLAQRWITWSFVRKNPRIIAAMLFAAGFMAAMMAAYVIHYILLTGQIEARGGQALLRLVLDLGGGRRAVPDLLSGLSPALAATGDDARRGLACAGGKPRRIGQKRASRLRLRPLACNEAAKGGAAASACRDAP